jgi:glutathione S-transferase
VSAKLYSLELSHPSHAARLMLERKGVEHRVVNVMPGFHPPVVRAAGFRRETVPALKVDGRRVQGSREIARFLEQVRPDPPLFPADAERRRAVEKAELWGERVLQPTPRRAFRWATANHLHFRRWIAGDVMGLPAPAVMARLNTPLARRFARTSGAVDEVIRGDMAELPERLDHVDALIASGVIGGEEPTAADFQIGTTIRVLLAWEDLRPLIEPRPCGDLARRVLPDYPEPIPRVLPRDWL